MNVVIVYNPNSGSALTQDEIRARCDENNITINSFVALQTNLDKKLAPFIKQKAIIAAIGGDGTLSAVAGALAGSGAIFAPLPGGTLNHFTKDLGVSQDIDDAIAELPHLESRKVDVATVNNRVFINNSSVGLYPSSLHTRKRFEDNFGKWPSAIIASIHTFIRFRTYVVTINNETFKTPFVFVGNNEYAMKRPGDIMRRNINKGELSVFIAKTTSRAVLLKIVLLALIGKIKNLDEFETRKTSSFVLKTSKTHVSVSRDGEVEHISSPLHFEIQRGALNVLAPNSGLVKK